MAPLDDALGVVAVLVFALLLNHPIDLNLHICPRGARPTKPDQLADGEQKTKERLVGPFLMCLENGWNAETKKCFQNLWSPFRNLIAGAGFEP